MPLYLIRAFVKHLSCPRELVGVRGVLCPCGAGGTRAAGGQVTADSLLGHIIGQAAAAGAGCWWGASAVERRADSMFYCHYYAVMTFWAFSLGDVTMRSVQLLACHLPKLRDDCPVGCALASVCEDKKTQSRAGVPSHT